MLKLYTFSWNTSSFKKKKSPLKLLASVSKYFRFYVQSWTSIFFPQYCVHQCTISKHITWRCFFVLTLQEDNISRLHGNSWTDVMCELFYIVKWLYKSESFLMVYLSVAKEIDFSPTALTDPVPVTAKKNVSNCCYILGRGCTFFSCVQGFKITFILNKNWNSLLLQCS